MARPKSEVKKKVKRFSIEFEEKRVKKFGKGNLEKGSRNVYAILRKAFDDAEQLNNLNEPIN